MNKNHLDQDSQFNPLLIPLKKAEPFKLWQRIKMTFRKSDLDFQQWQTLESKKTKQSSSTQWRNN